MAGGQWGLDFGNYGTNGSDRIKFTTAIGDLALGAIIEKRVETDTPQRLANINAIDDDADFDVYHLFGVYKQETFETGLLLTYGRDRRNAGGSTPAVVPTGTANTQVSGKSDRDRITSTSTSMVFSTSVRSPFRVKYSTNGATSTGKRPTGRIPTSTPGCGTWKPSMLPVPSALPSWFRLDRRPG
jgi:hypothetical protein